MKLFRIGSLGLASRFTVESSAARVRKCSCSILSRYGHSSTAKIPQEKEEEENTTGQIFTTNQRHGSINWERLLQEKIDVGNASKAKNTFFRSIEAGFKPCVYQGNRILALCMNAGKWRDVEQVFDKMPERDNITWNTMISCFAKAGMLEMAGRVFQGMPIRDSGSWNALIGGFAKHGRCRDSLDFFREMLRQGFNPSYYTFGSIFMACASSRALSEGMQIHGSAVKLLLCSILSVGSAIVDMYGKCGRLQDARQVFDEISAKNTVLWTIMISAYAHNSKGRLAFELFREMVTEGVSSNQFTYPSLLMACVSLLSVKNGSQIHALIVKDGFETNSFVRASLVNMYSKCGSLDDGRRAVGDVATTDEASCNAMITGFVKHGMSSEAIGLFREMQQACIKVDVFTFPSVLNACAGIPDIMQGKMVHTCLLKTGFSSSLYVGNALIDMYAKHGDLEDACQAMKEMPHRDVVTWTAICAAYVDTGNGEEVLKLFNQMRRSGTLPDEYNLSAVLSACSSIFALDEGKQIHCIVLKSKKEGSLSVQNALVTMYARCGDIEDAYCIFQRMPTKDLVSWTALIMAYAQNGRGKDALNLYEQMVVAGIKPDHVTFVAILFACSHAGLVKEGYHYFESMKRDYKISPRTHHYACMIDLVGRAGHTDKVEEVLNNMTIEPDATVWKAVLAACRKHGNMELAKQASKNLFELEPHNSASYVLLSNIHAASDAWEEVAAIRKIMRDKNVRKEPGISWIHVGKRVHVFRADDQWHPERDKIYEMLHKLTRLMKESGYVPDTRFVLHDIDDEHKENVIKYHSEKIALAYALKASCPGSPIRIFMNLRVCGDCHTAIKIISKIVDRKIILKDPNRFHHFEHGVCSCGDYW